MNYKSFVFALGLLLVSSSCIYAQNKGNLVTQGVKGATTKQLASTVGKGSTALPGKSAPAVTRAVLSKKTFDAASPVGPAMVKGAPTGTSAVPLPPVRKGVDVSRKVAPGTPTAKGSSTQDNLSILSPADIEQSRKLTHLLSTDVIYENGIPFGEITELLINQAMKNLAKDAVAWDVRKETHQLAQRSLGFSPKVFYTHDAINDVFDAFSLQQFMAKNGGNFPINFAETAAGDGIGEQMSTFLIKRYLLSNFGTLQAKAYVWNLYVQAPNARTMEEIVSDVEAFEAENGRLPGIVFFAGSEEVAPVMRSAMNMSPEEVALGAQMLLVTHVSDWSWMHLSKELDGRIRSLYTRITDAVESWRGEAHPFRRMWVEPNQ